MMVSDRAGYLNSYRTLINRTDPRKKGLQFPAGSCKLELCLIPCKFAGRINDATKNAVRSVT